ARRRRDARRGDRPARAPEPRHGTQLPVVGRDEARRREPSRGRPDRSPPRVDLRPAGSCGPAGPGHTGRPVLAGTRRGGRGGASPGVVVAVSCRGAWRCLAGGGRGGASPEVVVAVPRRRVVVSATPGAGSGRDKELLFGGVRLIRVVG